MAKYTIDSITPLDPYQDDQGADVTDHGIVDLTISIDGLDPYAQRVNVPVGDQTSLTAALDDYVKNQESELTTPPEEAPTAGLIGTEREV